MGMANPKLELLKAKAVQEDLKLSDDQAKKVTEAIAKQKGMPGFPPKIQPGGGDPFKAIREANEAAAKSVTDLLKPEQVKRLGQLELQQRGPTALLDPKVSKDLNISKEQQTQLVKEIQGNTIKALTGFKPGGGKIDFQEIGKKIAELNQKSMDEVVKTFTPEQKTKWKELVGEPFKGVLPSASGPGLGIGPGGFPGGPPGGFPGGFPGGQPGFPGGQPGFPGGQPGFPGGQPGFPGGFPMPPGGQPGFPGGVPTPPGGQPGQPRPPAGAPVPNPFQGS
jgi:hypothetical protein